MDTKLYDICTFGEILIDFTHIGQSETGQNIFAQNPGGAPANVLVCASKLGAKTAFLGKAGQDMHGEFLKKTLENENVNTEGFLLDKHFFTTLAFVELNEHGDRRFAFARKPGADTQMKNEEIDIDIVEKSKIFHVGSLSLTDEPSKGTTFYAIEKARQAQVLISYDPNYRASLWKSESIAKEQMQRIITDIMKISDEETLLLTHHQDYKQAAQELLEKGVKIVVVTLGNEGAYVRTKSQEVLVEGYKSKVVDTTGAGDSFWGGFLYNIAKYYDENKDIENISQEKLIEITKFANIVASLCVEKSGAIPAMPTKEEVLNRLKEIN